MEGAVIANASLWGVTLLTWSEVKTEGISDLEYALILNEMLAGNVVWLDLVKPQHIFRNGLSNVDGVAMNEG